MAIIINQHWKYIKVNTNKPIFGPVVLNIPWDNFHKQDIFFPLKYAVNTYKCPRGVDTYLLLGHTQEDFSLGHLSVSMKTINDLRRHLLSPVSTGTSCSSPAPSSSPDDASLARFLCPFNGLADGDDASMDLVELPLMLSESLTPGWVTHAWTGTLATMRKINKIEKHIVLFTVMLVCRVLHICCTK